MERLDLHPSEAVVKTLENGFFPEPAQTLLLDLLRERITLLLSEHLHFAVPEEVAALVVKQAQHTHFSATRIAEILRESPSLDEARRAALVSGACSTILAAAFVKDCELVAEFVAPQTVEERRLGLLGELSVAYAPFVCVTLRAILLERGRENIDRFLADYCQDVIGDTFNLPAFWDLARRYRPSLGRTFEKFVEQTLLWKCLNLCSTGDPGLTATADEADREQAMAEPTAEPEASRQLSRIQNALAALGASERAVLELRQKAYLAPAEMSQTTREMIVARSATIWNELEAEYRASQDEYRELAESKLAMAHGELERCRYILETWRERLNALQVRRSKRDRLVREADGKSIGELEDRLTALPRLGEEWIKVQFQLAWRRYQEALMTRERLQEKYQAYQRAGTHWIRSDAEIGCLLNLSQPTVWRIRSKAMKRLRSCLEDGAKAPPRDDDE